LVPDPFFFAELLPIDAVQQALGDGRILCVVTRKSAARLLLALRAEEAGGSRDLAPIGGSFSLNL
jgi:hypothetical protein